MVLNMAKILIVEPLDEETLELYSKKWHKWADAIDYYPCIREDDIANTLCTGRYDALVVRNKEITRAMISKWAASRPSGKLCIVRAGSNISTIDIKAATEFGIAVMNTPGANSYAVAQYIISQFILLSSGHKIEEARADVKNMVMKEKRLYSSHTFAGDTLALIGTGAIGSKVGLIASALGIKVKAYSPALTKERANILNAEYCHSLEEAFAGADLISIQVPFTTFNNSSHPATKNMIDSRHLSLAKKGAKLVNVSRRDVINMNDLVSNIENERFSGVSLDLLRSEIEEIRNSFPSIFNKPSVIITPLIACESPKADKEIAKQSLNKIEQFMNSKFSAKQAINPVFIENARHIDN
jgi:D-3-phosphoglycerate dehydrogenase